MCIQVVILNYYLVIIFCYSHVIFFHYSAVVIIHYFCVRHNLLESVNAAINSQNWKQYCLHHVVRL